MTKTDDSAIAATTTMGVSSPALARGSRTVAAAERRSPLDGGEV